MSKSVFTQRYESLRRALVEARTSRGLTQSALSKRLRRPQSFVSKYERGERRLDVIEFVELAEALELDPSKLLGQVMRG